ncbi:4'-phosphopantetheinyl transferase superfamily protein [Mesorhizobium sp. M6A.T.Ce.TU.016.01.1.1]|uniref:4'-phosphopantetheinyl transferase family protein n=1 Tax=Mesorhizobium sp. M6A.T.Ce.TU.016.01.1.1 TaxID=2496783 RepID=UPI00163BB8D0|nr:4'-phosphopantetheinyl transferase superfamily protein [Mesorhizobium sp. M6A.T.Ce.TU.016.01.1.1]
MIRVMSPNEQDDDLLDASERMRAARFRRDADRNRFATGRAMVKTLVAELASVEPNEVSVVSHCRHCGSAEHGKPRAMHPRGGHSVSISHSGSAVLVAATSGPECGADIQEVDPCFDHVALSRHIESPAERGTIRDAAGFYQLWTSKEAILKCTGDGLMVSMSGLTLGVPEITLRNLDIAGPFVAAVAVATNLPLAVELVDWRLPSF